MNTHSTLAALSMGLAASLASAAARPNILVVVADDISPAYFGAYGGRTPTPHLDRLASGGVRFERAYAVAPLCNPSRYALFTGRYPSRSAAVAEKAPPDSPLSVSQNTRLLAGDATLARALSSAGYFTAHVGKWHSNFEYGPIPDFPTGRDIHDPATDAILKERTRMQAQAVRSITGFDRVDAFVSGNLDTLGPQLPDASVHNPERQTQATLSAINDAAAEGKPFYIHLANTIPHSPDNLIAVDADPRFSREGLLDPVPSDHPPRPTVRARMARAGFPGSGYVASNLAGCIMLDDQMGAIVKKLDELGLRDNTVIVFVGDHGITGKGSPFAVGNHVPMIVSWPAGLVGAPAVMSQPVSLVDVVPTLLASAGLDPRATQADGVNLLPALQGEPNDLASRPVFIEAGVTRSVIVGDWQYIAFRPSTATLQRLEADEHADLPDLFDYLKQPFQRINLPHKPGYFDPDQLYHLPSDPFSRNNLASHPDFARRLRSLKQSLGQIVSTLPGPFPLDTPAVMTSAGYRSRAGALHEQAVIDHYQTHPYDLEYVHVMNKPEPE
jgi:arylsulfatase A-like enzyme